MYEELRKLASQRLAREKPRQTLQGTALVHEACLRLVGGEGAGPQRFSGRGHFFAAAAEAMRRILVDAARRKLRTKHGGGPRARGRRGGPRRAGEARGAAGAGRALGRLAGANRQAADLVKLRHFAGLTNAEAADALGISARKANQVWAYARAWLRDELVDDVEGGQP